MIRTLEVDIQDLYRVTACYELLITPWPVRHQTWVLTRHRRPATSRSSFFVVCVWNNDIEEMCSPISETIVAKYDHGDTSGILDSVGNGRSSKVCTE